MLFFSFSFMFVFFFLLKTHIHLAAGMTGDHLLEFIMDKYKTSPNDKVFQNLTLSQLFEKLQLKVETLTINALDCQADSAFERFDVFVRKEKKYLLTKI